MPSESPIRTITKNMTYLSMTPSKSTNQEAYGKLPNRRRTLSDYRTEVNSSITVNPNPSGKTVSTIKNLASGLGKFTSKRMVRNETLGI